MMGPQADLDVRVLLPRNVVVYETDEGKTHVSAVNPVSALEIIKTEELGKIAEEVSGKLKRVIEKTTNGQAK